MEILPFGGRVNQGFAWPRGAAGVVRGGLHMAYAVVPELWLRRATLQAGCAVSHSPFDTGLKEGIF